MATGGRVLRLDGLSAHADYNEILGWRTRVPTYRERIALTSARK
jgi:hypothetical protein